MTSLVKQRSLSLVGGALVLLAADLAAAQGACGLAKSRTSACVFQLTDNPGNFVSNDIKPEKLGKACAFNVLQIIALGDVRPATAALNGGITRIATVDSEAFEILPYYAIFSQYCTIVRGE